MKVKVKPSIVNGVIPPCGRHNNTFDFRYAHTNVRKVEKCGLGCCVIYQCNNCGQRFGNDQGHIKKVL